MTARGWLIDTNVISELRKGPRCDPAVRAWSENVAPAACFVSRVTLAEIRYGIERVTDPALRAELDAWVEDGVLAWFGTRVLEVDEAVLIRWRRLAAEGRKANYTFSPLDALIAATALVHDLAVVTRNGRDFVRAEVEIFDPWVWTG